MRFLTTPSIYQCILIIILSILIAFAGMHIVRRQVSYSTLKENNEVAGFVYSIIGAIYGVLLAFIVVVAWQQYSDAENSVQQEALRVNILLRDAQALPDSTRKQLQERLIAYAKAVVADEWNTLSGGQLSSTASEAYDRVWQAYYDTQPQTERERVFYHEAISRLNELAISRRSRLMSSRSGLPTALWVLLIGGGVIIVAFTYIFGIKSVWAQRIVLTSLVVLISFILFLILALDFPFSGNLRIEPDPIKDVIRVWEPRINN